MYLIAIGCVYFDSTFKELIFIIIYVSAVRNNAAVPKIVEYVSRTRNLSLLPVLY